MRIYPALIFLTFTVFLLALFASIATADSGCTDAYVAAGSCVEQIDAPSVLLPLFVKNDAQNEAQEATPTPAQSDSATATPTGVATATPTSEPTSTLTTIPATVLATVPATGSTTTSPPVDSTVTVDVTESVTPSSRVTAEPSATAMEATATIEATATATAASTAEATAEATVTPDITEIRNFIFGHSLLVHATDSDETTVPHWVHALARTAGYGYEVDGQYGFLPQHAQLPPQPQWGFETVPGVWDADSGATFGQSDFTTILLTAANFIQYQPATVPYEGDNPSNATPLGATLDIIDWAIDQEPTITFYIYENWPDMASFLGSGFPPAAQEFAAYNAYTQDEFHQWWVDYYGELTSARSAANIEMISVGPIIAKLLTETELSQIPVTDLYEDDAPHGEPTIYFLASLVTYMSLYDEKAPADFVMPDTVHSLVRNNYSTVVDFIWDELTVSTVQPAPTAVESGGEIMFDRPAVSEIRQVGGALTVAWSGCEQASSYRVLYGLDATSGDTGDDVGDDVGDARPNTIESTARTLTTPILDTAGTYRVTVECYDALGNSVFSQPKMVEVTE